MNITHFKSDSNCGKKFGAAAHYRVCYYETGEKIMKISDWMAGLGILVLILGLAASSLFMPSDTVLTEKLRCSLLWDYLPFAPFPC